MLTGPGWSFCTNRVRATFYSKSDGVTRASHIYIYVSVVLPCRQGGDVAALVAGAWGH